MVVASRDDLRVMTHHGAAVVHLGVGLLALGGEGLLALLNVGGVHNGLAHGPGDLAGVLLGDLVALSVHLLLTVRTRGVASVSWLGLSLGLGDGAGESGSSQEKGGANLVHHLAGNN